MAFLSNLFYVLILLESFAFLTNSYQLKSHSLRDLEQVSSSSAFDSEAALWESFNSPTSQKYISCAGTYFIDGAGYSVSRQYYGLPAHNSLYISLRVMMIDYWDSKDQLKIEIGDALHLDNWFFIDSNYSETNYSEKTCGGQSQYDLAVNVLIQVPHTASSLKIGFARPDLSSTYFGVRDIDILFSMNTVSTPSICGNSYPRGLLATPNLNCACPQGKFWNVTGLPGEECVPCDPSCLSCTGPTPNDCLSCSREYNYNGWACVPCTYLPAGECVSCPSNGFLQPDTVCKNTCPAPYYTSTTWNNNLFCTPKCAAPLYYSMVDGTCISSCDFPLITKFEDGNAFCSSPCPTGSFALPDRSCAGSCKSPYKENYIGLYRTCTLGAAKSSMMENAQKVIAMTSALTSTGLSAANAVSAGSPGGMSVGVMQKMFSYIKFINITYSADLEEALSTWKTDFVSFDFAPTLPEEMRDEDMDPYIPQTFVKYEVSSNFLFNFWDNLFSLMMTMSITFFLRIVEWICFKKRMKYLPHYLFHRIRIMAQNYFLTEAYGNIGDVLLYSVLQFMAVDPEAWYTPVNLSLCMGLLIIIIVALFLHFRLLRKYRRVKRASDRADDPSKLENFREDNAGFEMLFRDFKDDTLLQQSFLLIFTIRDLIFSLVLTTLSKHPIVQITFATLLCVIMLLFLLFTRPYEDIVDQIQQIMCEAIVLVMNGSIFILQISDILDSEVFDIREPIGKLITMTNVVFGFATLVFLGLKFYYIFRTIYREAKLYLNRKRKRQRRRMLVNGPVFDPTQGFGGRKTTDNAEEKVNKEQKKNYFLQKLEKALQNNSNLNNNNTQR